MTDVITEDPVRTIGEWFAPMSPPSPDGIAVPDGAAAHADGISGSPGRRKDMPVTVKALTWMFATGRHSAMFRSAAQRVFGIR